MREQLEELLIRLTYEEALLLVPGQMDDKTRSWMIRALQTIQRDSISSDDDLAEVSDEELMRIFNGNNDHQDAGSGSILEPGQPELSDEAEASGSEVVPIRSSK